MRYRISIICLLALSIAQATVINVPTDSSTIQSGINGAVDGDTVLVQPGRYVENINLYAKRITLGSLTLITGDTYCISQTIIDGDTSGSVVRFESGEDSTTIINGFTITDGHAEFGGGIYCNESSPKLENLIVCTNSASEKGGGIYCSGGSNSSLENVIVSGNEGTGISCSSSSPSLLNVTVSGNDGCGISCLDNSSPRLVNVTVNENKRTGISCYGNSNPSLSNVVVSGNTAAWGAGGIFCENSSPSLLNVTVSENSGRGKGGGICCTENSSPSLVNVTMSGNSVSDAEAFHAYDPGEGGGIYCSTSSPNLTNVIVRGNSAESAGGGIYLADSSPSLENVTVTRNIAYDGGGIYCENSNPSYNLVNRCNIYFNNAYGQELVAYFDTLITPIRVVVDTFTVMNPTAYHASPRENFTFDILQAKVEQVETDLYVSPSGNDANGGLSPSDPLRTIFVAFIKVLADSLHPHTVYLADGTYSSSTNGELFPLRMPDHISLSGASEESVILDAEGHSRVLEFHQTREIIIENLTIRGGSIADWVRGGGILCNESNPSLLNITVSGNTADIGGGIYCFASSPSLVNVTVSGNSASWDGGGLYFERSSPSLADVTVRGNSAESRGGGIYFERSSPSLANVTVHGNSASDEGGGICCIHSSPSFNPSNRCNIYLNQATRGQDLFAHFDNSSPIHVVVDTFTVMNPNYHHASPRENFTFDILHAKVEQVGADLYVNPSGNDANGGLSPSDPLRTIFVAFIKVLADSLHPHTVYLADGTYSPSTNGELFPLRMLDHISLSGASEESVILDAEGHSRVLEFHQTREIIIENLTIRGGSIADWVRGGGILCKESNPSLLNITVRDNTADNGGGIFFGDSSPNLVNVTVSGNSARWCGGGIFFGDSSPNLVNVTVSGNVASESGGGIFCSDDSYPVAVNTILWYNSPEEIYSESASIAATYSNIRGGWAGSGNIDADPLFVDTTSGDYHLQAGSPCIDAGNPNSIYNDPEDPSNPGFALWPALGTVRNDMGAYGGDPSVLSVLAVDDGPAAKQLPIGFALHQNYPNPFNPMSTIRYDLPQATDVSLIVYDILGREMARIVDGYIEPGYHQVQWDGRNANGLELPSGVYIARLVTREYRKSMKMVLLR